MSNSSKKRILNALPQLCALIGVITAIASLSTMNLYIVAASLALIVISALVLLLRTSKKYSRNPAVEILDQSIEPHSELEVRHVRNKAELKEKSNLDLECYGEHVIDFEGLLMWWGRYPNGTYELFEGGRLIGSIDIWPIPKTTFDLLVAGKLKERDFREDDICQKCEKQIYWYLGSILIEKAHRRFGAQGRLRQYETLKRFIEETLEQWLSDTQALSDDKLELCALVASAQGENLLKKFGFHANDIESPDGLPVYIRTTSIAEIRRDIPLIFKSQKVLS